MKKGKILAETTFIYGCIHIITLRCTRKVSPSLMGTIGQYGAKECIAVLTWVYHFLKNESV